MAIAPITVHCDLEQADAFSSLKELNAGYLTHLKLGTKDFKNEVREYHSPLGEKVKAVGLIEVVHYNGGESDPIDIKFWVPRDVWTTAQSYTSSKSADAAVKISFETFEHFKEKNKTEFFKRFWTGDEEAPAVIGSEGGVRVIRTGPQQDTYKNLFYWVQLRLEPVTHHVLHYALAKGNPDTTDWSHK